MSRLAGALLCILAACQPARPGRAPEPAATLEEAVCAAHGAPEALCPKCNPALAAVFQAKGDWCPDHGFPASFCPSCSTGGDAAPGVALAGAAALGRPGHGARIRFRSPEIERDAGIDLATARAATVGLAIECTARLVFDQNRVADIRAPLAGVVRSLHVDEGARVEAGAALFVLESPTVGDLQGRLRAARKHVEVAQTNLERQEELRAASIATERAVELARSEYVSELAEERALAASLRISGGGSGNQEGRYTLKAPIAGTVVRRPATIGTYATAETSLAMIADTTNIWALLDVRDDEATRVQNGLRVTLTVDGQRDREFTGEVTWVSPEVDPRTRTVLVRAEFPNPDGSLRAQQFAQATIHVGAPRDSVVVPRESVQRVDDEPVVFVRARGGVYDTVPIEVGQSIGDLVEVIGPVEAGDRIVTTGAFLLKTELEKDSIGAGCCDVEGP